MTQREQIEKLTDEIAALRDEVAALRVQLAQGVVQHHHYHYPPATPAPQPAPFRLPSPWSSPNICQTIQGASKDYTVWNGGVPA